MVDETVLKIMILKLRKGFPSGKPFSIVVEKLKLTVSGHSPVRQPADMNPTLKAIKKAPLL
jgi:hypothetical protein